DLVLVDQNEPRHHDRVQGERDQAHAPWRPVEGLRATDEVEEDGAEREEAGRQPGQALVAGGVVRAEQADLDDRERHRSEPDPRDPALSRSKPFELAGHGTANRSFSSAMRAFRWRKRPSLRGTYSRA